MTHFEKNNIITAIDDQLVVVKFRSKKNVFLDYLVLVLALQHRCKLRLLVH